MIATGSAEGVMVLITLINKHIVLEMSNIHQSVFSASDLTEKSFPRWVHDLSAMYYHKEDKDGRPICTYCMQCHVGGDRGNW